MTCPAEIGMGKTNNGGVFVLITRTILISFLVVSSVFMVHGNKICLRTQLNHPKRGCGSGIGMSHFAGTHKRIHKLSKILFYCSLLCTVLILTTNKKEN